MAPLKALKVNPGSTAHWVAEAQATIQRGTASMRSDPKEPATKGGATEATPTQTGEGAPPPHEGEAHESDGAEADTPEARMLGKRAVSLVGSAVAVGQVVAEATQPPP